MKYAYTIFYVREVSETVNFYEKAFGLKRKFVTPENDYAELNSGETTIAFASVELGNSNLKNDFIKSSLSERPFGMELAFTTEMIEEDFEIAIKAGAIVIQGITEKPWGQKVGYVRDINGFLIEICTPIKG